MQEQIETQNEQIDLNEQEQERLDQLLTSARNFHYISFERVRKQNFFLH